MAVEVGSFPGLNQMKRRTIRAPVNPLDKSTIVSIYPRRIDEIKHTIQPGRFIIEPGSVAKPTLLVVGPSSWWKDIDEDQPLLEIPNSSIQIADSVVRDYCSGLLACNMSDCMPGIFWVPGEFDLLTLKIQNKPKLDAAVVKQRNYFLALVKLADGLWARTSGNPLTISDDMRMAARELNLVGKDWMKDFTTIVQTKCIACGALRNPEYPICGTCHAIADPVKAKELGLVFAQ